MRIEQLHFDQIRYNPEAEGFEARVTLHDHGIAFHYAAFMPAPLTAEFDHIARGLSDRAIATHRSARPGMRMRLKPLTRAVPHSDHWPIAA